MMTTLDFAFGSTVITVLVMIVFTIWVFITDNVPFKIRVGIIAPTVIKTVSLIVLAMYYYNASVSSELPVGMLNSVRVATIIGNISTMTFILIIIDYVRIMRGLVAAKQR